ncbi:MULTISPECIES: VacJ family lipoprotein [Methylomonas]|uniref:ABC transporter n=2 Tax=Methylomonas TaxID=416 RepID=A0A140E485_9GAMM|nr:MULTISPECIES: VacJ family lipoprotein [Methylomonas]AMK75209.1 ABC transporter [Methylomonas denitrificans]OAH99395.1 ABC transporter [Methylomonas methanica]TCV85044.1 phospholipid-binding lipoprotein MlaA [Methylomonas methanica]
MFTQLHPGKNRALLLEVFLLTSALLMPGCASTEKRDEFLANEAGHADPYEGFNRSMYGFNMSLDKYFFKPVSDGYKFITPDFVETGVNNFFSNLKGINVVLNDVLQGKFQQSASDAGRFLTNTTIGVAGLIDVASEVGLKNNVEDFGQTLAVWGVGQGAYLVLPVMGPTTIRDGGAGILDKAANPGTYVPGTGILEGINDRANAEGALNFINEAALDPYVFTRESFLQYRRNLINDGKNDSASYDLDIDTAAESSAEPNVKKPEASQPAVDTTGKIAESAPSSSQPVEAGSGGSTAFDNMLQSFEQASNKLDQLSKRKRKK